jgi:hypothetical protein
MLFLDTARKCRVHLELNSFTKRKELANSILFLKLNRFEQTKVGSPHLSTLLSIEIHHRLYHLNGRTVIVFYLSQRHRTDRFFS